MNIYIDGTTAEFRSNYRFRGAGMVSGNNSSRLLMDYKYLCPDSYYQILERVFGSDGVGVTHLKIEMGSDINSSSGTEPCIMRRPDEAPDVTRGAAFMLCADAKKINPGLTLDMLWWGEPKWIGDAPDVYDARYRWYKANLDEAYFTYGIRFDYVSVVQNERAHDINWIKYFVRRLRSEKDAPYDYSKIGIVAGEEVCTWGLAENILCDSELHDMIDVIGSHYTSSSSDTAKELADRYGKELWVSEGSPPMKYKNTYKSDGSFLSGLGGGLDIADRIIAMFPMGDMTMYEYQPVVSAYYDGVCYGFKQIITANTPWNGGFDLDIGYYISLHFSLFIKKGWVFIRSGCSSDCVPGGDGHCLTDGKYTYMTCASPDGKDHSIVITNSTDEAITYSVSLANIPHAHSVLHCFLTTGADNRGHFLERKEDIIPVPSCKGCSFSVSVPPQSLMTISTLLPVIRRDRCERDDILALPYEDRFDEPEEFLSRRGHAPLYTTDQGGAFEIEDGRLVQQITSDMKPADWGYTPDPTTNLGDDRWYNYTVSADVKLSDPDSGYIGIGLRYSLACAGAHGYRLLLFPDKWQLAENDRILAEGSHDADMSVYNRLSLSAYYGEVTASLGETVLVRYTSDTFTAAGRAALYSSYHRNSFAALRIEPLEDSYIRRYDDTDDIIVYSGDWEHKSMEGFANFRRTLSVGRKGAKAVITYTGKSYAVFGRSGSAKLCVSADGVRSVRQTSETAERGVSLTDKLPFGHHTVTIEVLEGEYTIDGIETVE
ncbi:MAG: glycosyl hydrolase family 59 [Oscillospiraceae bacterium]|nr:glycosyl hydrolase family 59 [Oscillospiraceae bacterium]